MNLRPGAARRGEQSWNRHREDHDRCGFSPAGRTPGTRLWSRVDAASEREDGSEASGGRSSEAKAGPSSGGAHSSVAALRLAPPSCDQCAAGADQSLPCGYFRRGGLTETLRCSTMPARHCGCSMTPSWTGTSPIAAPICGGSAPTRSRRLVREDRVVLLPDIESYRVQVPRIVADANAAGVQASASVPLHQVRRYRAGCAHPSPGPTRPCSMPNWRLRCEPWACTVVETVERAERFDADHELVVAVRRRILGDLLRCPASRPLLASFPPLRTFTVGGDWYEGLVLGSAGVALVVGDVTGHGIAAAADMALIRGMVSALLLLRGGDVGHLIRTVRSPQPAHQ